MLGCCHGNRSSNQINEADYHSNKTIRHTNTDWSDLLSTESPTVGWHEGKKDTSVSILTNNVLSVHNKTCKNKTLTKLQPGRSEKSEEMLHTSTKEIKVEKQGR